MERVETDESIGLRPSVMTPCVRMFLRFTVLYNSNLPAVCVGSIRLPVLVLFIQATSRDCCKKYAAQLSILIAHVRTYSSPLVNSILVYPGRL